MHQRNPAQADETTKVVQELTKFVTEFSQWNLPIQVQAEMALVRLHRLHRLVLQNSKNALTCVRKGGIEPITYLVINITNTVNRSAILLLHRIASVEESITIRDINASFKCVASTIRTLIWRLQWSQEEVDVKFPIVQTLRLIAAHSTANSTQIIHEGVIDVIITHIFIDLVVPDNTKTEVVLLINTLYETGNDEDRDEIKEELTGPLEYSLSRESQYSLKAYVLRFLIKIGWEPKRIWDLYS